VNKCNELALFGYHLEFLGLCLMFSGAFLRFEAADLNGKKIGGVKIVI
jgi:hypothetical protein